MNTPQFKNNFAAIFFGAVFVLFQVKAQTAASANTSPTISPILNQIIGVDSSTGPLPFTIGDADTSVEQLAVGHLLRGWQA